MTNYPEVGSAEYPPHCEALCVRLSKARRLNVAPAADALARLRVLEHRILSVNLMLCLEVVGVGGGPVAIQGRSDVVVFHLDLPLVDASKASPGQPNDLRSPKIVGSSSLTVG
jgi:hypothetical protein